MVYDQFVAPLSNRRFANHPVAIDRRSVVYSPGQVDFLSSPLWQVGAGLLVFLAILVLVYAFLGAGWTFAIGGIISSIFIALVIDGMRIAAQDLDQY